MSAAVGSLTDCAVCMEELNSPKFLPCHHTLCLKCIENLRPSHPGRGVPCPFCRSTFSAPAASLPTNNYAEELVRLTRDAQEAERQMETVMDELEAAKTQMEEMHEALQAAVDEKGRLNSALTATKKKLTELGNHSAQVKQQLESKVDGLQRNLTTAESRESCLKEQLWEAVERLSVAECQREKASIEAKSCQTVKNDAEASLARAEQSCQDLSRQLQQIQRQTSKQLKDAELRHDAAKLEAETYQKAKNGIQVSLAMTKQSCRMLRKQLQQTQREMDERTKMLETELGRSSPEVISLNEQLVSERLKLRQQQDYKKSHTEVVRLCLVLLALLWLSVIGVAMAFENRCTATVEAKEAQLIDSYKLSLRLEELAVKLQTARYDVRDTRRMLNECSERLAATQQALNATEINLKDANKVLSGIDCGKDKREKVVEKTSEKCSICSLQLEEARANQHNQETMMKNCYSRLSQAREDNRTASATVRECSHHRNRLQQQLEECSARLLQHPVAKDELPEVRKQGCNCDRQSTQSKNGKEAIDAAERSEGKSSGSKKTVSTTDLADKHTSSCARQLTEVQANLTSLETTLENCSSRLKQVRADKLEVAAEAGDCKRELSLEREGASLIHCENQLKQARSSLSNAMKQCPGGSKSKPNAPEAALKASGNDRPSTKSKDKSAKLTRCNEELTTATDTVRWKTKQMERCAENLVQARGEVQSLSASLSETKSNQKTIIVNLKLRHQEQLGDLRLYYEQKLEQAADACGKNSLLVSINKTIFVIFVILVIYRRLFLPVMFNLFLLLNNYCYRFRTLVGIRDRRVLYRGKSFKRYR